MFQAPNLHFARQLLIKNIGCTTTSLLELTGVVQWSQGLHVLHKTIGFRRVKTHVNSAYQHVIALTTKISKMTTLFPIKRKRFFPQKIGMSRFFEVLKLKNRDNSD